MKGKQKLLMLTKCAVLFLANRLEKKEIVASITVFVIINFFGNILKKKLLKKRINDFRHFNNADMNATRNEKINGGK